MRSTRCKIATQIHAPLHASHSAVPKERFQNFCTNLTLSALSKFLRNAVQPTQCLVYFLLCIPQQSVTHPLTVFTSQLCTLPRSAYTGGTRSHCMGIFRAVNVLFFSLEVIIILVPLTTRHISSFL